MLASLYAGSTEENAFEIVRRATFWSYFFGFLILPLVAGYLTYLITVRTKIEGLLWKYVEWVVFFLGVIFTAINYDGGMFYRIDTIDSPREQLYSLFPGILLMFGLLISVGVVLEYLKLFINSEKAAFISFLALPFLALFYWLFLGGPSLVILSVLISTLILYFSYEFNSREYRIELERYGFEDVLIHSRNRYSIDTDRITCDYFDYITGKNTGPDSYHGEFMTQYSWAEQFIYMLDMSGGKIMKNKKLWITIGKNESHRAQVRRHL